MAVEMKLDHAMPGTGRAQRPGYDDGAELGGVRFERLLILPRALVGIAVGVMSLLVPGVWGPGLLLVGAYFVGVSVVAARMLGASAGERGPFLWTSVADVVGCLGVLVLLGATPGAPAALLFPLLTFELALKYCVRGAAVAMALLSIAVALRLSYRTGQYALAPRVWLILLVLSATALLLGIAGTLRAGERARSHALADRQRLAELLRATVEATLDEAGIRHGSSGRREDLLALVEQACAHPELSGDFARRLAAAVSTRGADCGPLSAREQQILALVADGLVDRDIARHLFLSRGTVRVHMSHIVHKLQVSSREEAVTWYRQRVDPVPQA